MRHYFRQRPEAHLTDPSGRGPLWLNTQGHRGAGAVVNTPAGLLVHFFLLFVHSGIGHADRKSAQSDPDSYARAPLLGFL